MRKRNRGKSRGKKYITIALLAAFCAVPAAGVMPVQAALENEKDDEVRSVFIKDGDVEQSTLIIGSHLIHISALTEELYEIATESCNAFQQYEMYYKSELSGGQWYAISSAASIDEITGKGTPVARELIEGLSFTHHTKSDGVTYDLRDQQAVSKFDIKDPYDLELMEELEPLRIQYQLLQEKDEDTKTESDFAYMALIEEFYQTVVKSGATEECDVQLRALQNYRSVLTGNDGESAMTDKVDYAMGLVDAERRVESLTILEEELDLLERHASGGQTDEEAEEKEKKKKEAGNAIEDAAYYMERDEYDRAIERLEEAYDETELPMLEDEIKNARVEKQLYQADEALEEFKRLVKGWQTERSGIDDEISGLEKDLNDQEDYIEELRNQGYDENSAEMEEAVQERDEIYRSLTAKNDRKAELDELLTEESLEKAQKEALEKTVSDLQELYEELKDMRLYNKIIELGTVTELLPEEEKKDYTFTVNSEIVGAIGQCISNVQESLNRYRAKLLTEGTSVSSKAEARYVNGLTDSAVGGDHASCDIYVENLIDLSNIMEDKVVNRSRELALLDNDLVNAAIGEYRNALSFGISEDYQKALADRSSRAALNRLLEMQKSDTDTKRLDYQGMVAAKTKRMDNTEAQNYMLGLLDNISDLENAVKQDASASYQKQTVSEHLSWLKTELAGLVKEGEGDGTLDQLNQREDELSEQMRDALDQNDLAGAAAKEALLAAARKDIEDEQDRLSAILNAEGSSEADKARAAAELGEGSSASNLNKIASDTASQIRNGNTEGLSKAIAAAEAMGALDPAAAKGALAQMKEAAEDALALDSENVDNAALEDFHEQADALSDSLSEQGAGGLGEVLSREALLSLLEELLGGGFDSLSGQEKAAMVLAIEWYGEYALSSDILSLAAEYAEQLEKENSFYVYPKYEQELTEYISLRALGNALGFRYIFDELQQTVTLQKSLSYYQFRAEEKGYVMTEEKEGSLLKPCGAQDTLYLSEKDAKTLFACEAEYMDRSSLGMAVPQEIKAAAEELYQALLQ